MIVHVGDETFQISAHPRGAESGEWFPQGGFIQVYARGDSRDFTWGFDRDLWAVKEHELINQCVQELHARI